MLHQVSLEEFVRRRAVKRQGRRPQEYAHISRASDEVFRKPGKQNNSRVNWGSNNMKDSDAFDPMSKINSILSILSEHNFEITKSDKDFFEIKVLIPTHF